jgi:hypothetical protein
VRPESDREEPELPLLYRGPVPRILRAVVAVIRPPDFVLDAEVDSAVLRTALSFVPYLPAPMRLGLPIGLVMIEYGPLAFGEGPRRFSTMDGARGARYLRRWEHTFGPLALLFKGLRALVLLSFYQQPQVLAALEVDWAGRARELVARRAELLEPGGAARADLAPARGEGSG